MLLVYLLTMLKIEDLGLKEAVLTTRLVVD